MLGSKGKGKGGFAVRKKDWLPGKGGGDAEALAERYGEYDPDAWTAQMQVNSPCIRTVYLLGGLHSPVYCTSACRRG